MKAYILFIVIVIVLTAQAAPNKNRKSIDHGKISMKREPHIGYNPRCPFCQFHRLKSSIFDQSHRITDSDQQHHVTDSYGGKITSRSVTDSPKKLKDESHDEVTTIEPTTEIITTTPIENSKLLDKVETKEDEIKTFPRQITPNLEFIEINIADFLRAEYDDDDDEDNEIIHPHSVYPYPYFTKKKDCIVDDIGGLWFGNQWVPYEYGH